MEEYWWFVQDENELRWVENFSVKRTWAILRSIFIKWCLISPTKPNQMFRSLDLILKMKTLRWNTQILRMQLNLSTATSGKRKVAVASREGTFLFFKNAYQFRAKPVKKCIMKIRNVTEKRINDARYGSVLVTFCDKKMALYIAFFSH